MQRQNYKRIDSQHDAAQPRRPRRLTWVLSVAVGLLVAGCASSTMETKPQQTEQLHLPPTTGWTLTNQTNAGGTRVMEYAADGSGENWKELMRVESFQQKPLPHPDTFLSNIAKERRNACPSLTVQPIRAGTENDYTYQVRMFVCPGFDSGKTPIELIKAIQGEDWFYVVSMKVQSREEITSDAEPWRPRVAVWSDFLSKVVACRMGPSAHPCPTTTQ